MEVAEALATMGQLVDKGQFAEVRSTTWHVAVRQMCAP